MFDRVYPAKQPHHPIVPGNVAASLIFHAVFIAAAGVSLPVYMNEQVTEGILFFAPLPAQRAEPAAAERLTYLEVPGGGAGLGNLGAMDVLGDGPAAPRGEKSTDAEEGNETTGVAALPEFPELKLDSIYFPDEVDNPAAYDPRSAAPAYPDSLQRLGVEGSVIAQFVVDTTGRGADSTLVIVSSTHPRFAESVRAAFPRMLFRPAELTGVKIRQLVQQTFTFRLPARPEASRDSVSRASRPSAIPPTEAWDPGTLL